MEMWSISFKSINPFNYRHVAALFGNIRIGDGVQVAYGIVGVTVSLLPTVVWNSGCAKFRRSQSRMVDFDGGFDD